MAALLAIARNKAAGSKADKTEEAWSFISRSGRETQDGDLEDVVLWVEIKKQIKILREGMDKEG